MQPRRKTHVRASKSLDAKAFAKGRLEGLSIEQSLLKAGATPSTAKRGMASVNVAMRRELATERKRRLVEAAELSRMIPDGEARDAVRGIILTDAAERNSKGTPAARLAAQMAGIELVGNDVSLAGVVMIELPKGSKADLPVIDAEEIKMLPAGPGEEVEQLAPTDPRRARYWNLLERRSSFFSLDPSVCKPSRAEMDELSELEAEFGKPERNPVPKEVSNG